MRTLNNTNYHKTLSNLVITSILIIAPLFLLYIYDDLYLNTSDSLRNQINTLSRDINQQIASNKIRLKSKYKTDIELPFFTYQQNFEGLQIDVDSLSNEQEDFFSSISSRFLKQKGLGQLYQHESVQILTIAYHQYSQRQMKEIEKMVSQILDHIKEVIDINVKVVDNHHYFNILPTNQLILVFKMIKDEQLEQNILQKIKRRRKDQDHYLSQIIGELKTLSAFKECRYTNIKCSQSILYFLNPNRKQSDDGYEYQQTDQDLFIIDEYDMTTIYNILADIFRIKELILLQQQSNSIDLKMLYDRLSYLAFLHQTLNKLSYLQFTHQSFFNISRFSFERFFNDPLRQISQLDLWHPYIHRKEESELITKYIAVVRDIINRRQSEKLKFNILENPLVGQLDMMTSDFKIGIYLPLVAMFAYPIILVLKFIISNLFRKRYS